jgi:putative spermidine/putrescine transport system ATP-binding protein
VLAGDTVTVLGATLPLLGTGPADGPVTAYIRPEDIALATTGIPATVVVSSFLGSLRRTQVRLDDGTLLFVQHDVRVRPTTGEQVHLQLNGTPVAASARAA